MLAPRERMIGFVAQLELTHESQEIVANDLRKLLSDDYLAMLAENE